MSETAAPYTRFILPPTISSRADLSRLVREVERVDQELIAATIRARQGMQVKSPVLSEALTAFLTVNKLAPTDSKQRQALIEQLRLLKDRAPVVHMTFAQTADYESLAELTQWLRTTVHPQAIVAAGLQPRLVAGVYLRTSNHVHDFSLRAKLADGHSVLRAELEALKHGR